MFSRRFTGSRTGSRPGLAALCLILASGGALADWIDDYKSGVAALDRSDYDRAIQFLSKAVSDKPRERASAIKTTGMFFEPYLPHYYLGLAFYGRKEYEKALQELRLSAAQGVITKYAEQNSRLGSHLKLCEQQIAAAPAKPVQDDSEARALAAARERSAQVLEAAGTFLTRRGAELTPEERARVETAMRDLSGASDSTAIALKTGELRGALESTVRAVTEREGRPPRREPVASPPRDRPARELGRMPPGTAGRANTGEPGPRAGAEPAPETPQVPPRPPARPEPPGPSRGETAPPVSRSAESAAQIRRGVESYFRGDDEAAITALTGVEQADADFYLGSALYRKYILGREQDSSLRDQAARHFRRVTQLAPAYRPDPRYFSPKVIAFFEQTSGRR
ncbi:MAG TPA: hypothetical protein VGK94_12935 [Candidatus Polarisedimenticolia bacterium]|jgi:tetratricopeptide (TPR) repeat protein